MNNCVKCLMVSLLILCVSLSACEKGSTALIDFGERINIWQLDSYFENGEDKTSLLTIQALNYDIREGDFYGFYYWYTTALGEEKGFQGDRPGGTGDTYGVDEALGRMFFNYGADSIQLSTKLTLHHTMSFEVLKLNANDFWCGYEEGGTRFELRFSGHSL